MTNTAIATIGEHDQPPSQALVPGRAGLSILMPIAAPDEILKAQETVRALVKQTLKEGRDFGEIPGIDKPALLKPGAERVTIAFGCTERMTIVEQEVDHDRLVPWIKRKKRFEGRGNDRRFVGWDEERGESYGLYRYVVRCDIVERASGAIVGTCLGTCSTMESKYIDRPRDCENTVIKMAQKRAHVGAALVTFGLSEQFTQDVEDMPRDAIQGAESTAAETGRAPAPPCPKCGGKMYDNRDTNLERKAQGKKPIPEFKCRDKACQDGNGNVTCIWHLKTEEPAPGKQEGGPGQPAGSTTTGKPAAGTPRNTGGGEITRDSLCTWTGHHKDMPLRELPVDAIIWGLEPGNIGRLGPRHAEWAAALKQELRERALQGDPLAQLTLDELAAAEDGTGPTSAAPPPPTGEPSPTMPPSQPSA